MGSENGESVRHGLDPLRRLKASHAHPAAWPYPRILAHRGGGTLAPENTLAALRHAGMLGFSGVEFDAMLARDGTAVLMHDHLFGRTIAACGKVSDFDASELGTMDAGSWHSARHAGEPVPALREALETCASCGLWANIEIKPSPGMEAETGAAVGLEVAMHYERVDAYRSASMQGCKPLLSSFSVTALVAARQAAPAISRALLVSALPSSWRTLLEECAAVALHVQHDAITPAIVLAVKEAGYGLMCYTVNDPARARTLLEWGVDALCTDRLDVIGPDFSAH